jgi:hypothetical protein
MKKISLALIMLIIVGICVPAVSADIVLNEHMSYFTDTSDSVKNTYDDYSGTGAANRIIINHIEEHKSLQYIAILCDGSRPYLEEGRHSITYTLNGMEKEGVVYVDHMTNILGTVTGARFTLFFYDWDVSGLSDREVITLSKSLGTFKASNYQLVPTGGPGGLGMYRSQTGDYLVTGGVTITFTVVSATNFESEIIVEDTGIMYEAVYNRHGHLSYIEFRNNGTVVYSDTNREDLELMFLRKEFDEIYVDSLVGKDYTFSLTGSAGQENIGIVTVYIRNSQTVAAIANSRCVIDALVDGDYYPVVNRTEPSGIFSVTLQPTGGGSPNPDGYRLIASADGYNNPMPEINFTVDEYKTSIYCYLDPIAGGPENENNTFIDFFVRDMSANPISGATVNFGGYTLITNSAGYTIFEVAKNKTYSWTVSKSGYGSLTGNAVIGSNGRHTINTVLAPAVTPTIPTAIPTSTPISPTPTLTAPTGEPVSNWLEWFAAHFGMILGGGAEIGKIFMWLCFAVPVGVYVGKEAKAGAAGFMAGAGSVTLFFVLIGWVPIWLLVLLALIIGLLYAKVINNSDTGGGR